MTLFVGEILGGSDLAHSRFVSRLESIKQTLAESQGEASDQGSLDIVFHVPGAVAKPDYEGLRTGRFSKRERTLMIQVAVPESEISSVDPGLFIFEAIRTAIRMAEPVFKTAGIHFSTKDYLLIVDAIEATTGGAE